MPPAATSAPSPWQGDPLALAAHAAANLLDPRPDEDDDDQPDAPADFTRPGELDTYVSRGRNDDWEHLRLIDQAIVDADAGRCDRILIVMPPQYGKTTRVKAAVAWLLRRNLDRRAIYASYEADVAAQRGREVREVFEDNPQLGVRIKRTSKAAKRWSIDGARGGMRCVGVRGPATGQSAEVLVIDDPVKNRQDAESPVIRESTWGWYTTVARTRLQPGGIIIVIMTRWHADDLAGRIEKNEPGRWRVIHLPVYAVENDPLGRAPGELLCPERFPAAHIAEQAHVLGPYDFSALYQGMPRPAAGGIFDEATFPGCRFTIMQTGSGPAYVVDDPARGLRIVHAANTWRFITADLAGSLRTSADWTVMSAWAVGPGGELILLDRVRQRLGKGQHLEPLLALARRTGATYAKVETRILGHDLLVGATQAGLQVTEAEPEGDKLVRALPASRRLAAGMVWWPKDAPWRGEWEDELKDFPVGAHDDQVDTLAYAVLELVKGSAGPVLIEPSHGVPADRQPFGADERLDLLTAGF